MDFIIPRRALAVAAVVLVVGIGLWWVFFGRPDTLEFMKPAPLPEVVSHEKGGDARVVVLTPPELGDEGQGGITLRSLVFPQLFTAQPDGTWRASLVKPGSDRTAADALSASFQLRPNAQWSNGTPITPADLRRNADPRWVVGVSDVDGEGRITVVFTTPFPNWRSLWSVDKSVQPAQTDIFGGPFVITTLVSGLHTVLAPNPKWYGTEGGPFLDSVTLVIAADNTLGRQLLATNQVDVFASLPDTVRTQQLRRLDGVRVSVEERGGAWTGLMLSDDLKIGTRQQLVHSFPRSIFVNALLHNEVSSETGFASDSDETWATIPAPTLPADAQSFTLAMPSNVPLMPNLQTAATTKFKELNQIVKPQTLDPAAMNSLFDKANYEVMVHTRQEGPAFCWQCTFGRVDPALAKLADGGDAEAARQLENRARDEALILPLFKPHAVVGWRPDNVAGPTANGFMSSTAWNAVHWHQP